MVKGKQVYKSILCKSWKIQNQICCFQLVAIIFCVILFLVSNLIFLQYFNNSQIYLTEIIFNIETKNHLERISYLEQQSTLQIFEHSKHQLLSINKLYQLIDQDFFIEMPYDCLMNNQYNDSYAYFFSFCYAFCNNTSEIQINKYQNILKLTSLLTQTLRIYDLYLITLIAHIGDEQFFAQNRGYALNKYYPHTRQWYIDHMEHMSSGEQIIISEPYVSWINVVFISQTTNLSNVELDGLIGQDLDFSRMPQLKTNTLSFFLVDQKGNIVISDLYANGVTILIKIYNQSMTGFNETDWNEFQNSEQDIFYQYNTQFMRKIIVLRKKLQSLNYYMFMTYDVSSYLEQKLEIEDKNYKFQSDSLQLSLTFLMIFLFFYLITQAIIINLLIKDLKCLEMMATKKVVYFCKRKTINYKMNDLNFTIRSLYNAFQNLINNFDTYGSFGKSFTCLTLESLSYPEKYTKLKLHIQTKQLQNQIKFPQTKILKQFLYFKMNNFQF